MELRNKVTTFYLTQVSISHSVLTYSQFLVVILFPQTVLGILELLLMLPSISPNMSLRCVVLVSTTYVTSPESAVTSHSQPQLYWLTHWLVVISTTATLFYSLRLCDVKHLVSHIYSLIPFHEHHTCSKTVTLAPHKVPYSFQV